MRRPHAAPTQAELPARNEAAGDFGTLSAAALELIAQHVISFRDKLNLLLVNRHWCSTLRGSNTLWASTVLDLEEADERQVAGMVAFIASRARGIHDLEISFGRYSDWPNLGFMLGMLRGTLRRCSLVGLDADCELPASGGACLYALRGLTSLDLDNCLQSLSPSIGQLTSLRELLVSREDGPSPEFDVPSEISRLQQLSRLELVRCTAALPMELSALSRLRLLNLEGSDLCECPDSVDIILQQLSLLEELDMGGCNLQDVPSAISKLSHLSTLSLHNAFLHSWDAATFDAKLACLSCLHCLLYLDMSENEMTAVPQPVAGLGRLETLKMGLNPLVDVADGPYLESLLHLDLRGSRIATLPQHLTRAQRLQVLGLSCCHELVLDSTLANDVIGRLKHLETIILCGQQMNTVDSARCLLQLGKMLPHLEVSSHGEADTDDDEDTDEDSEEDSEEEEESEFETEEDDFTSEDEFDSEDEHYEGGLDEY